MADFLARNEFQAEYLYGREDKEITMTTACMPDYFWSCKTCKDSGVHHDAHTMGIVLRQFHWGHDIWIEFGGWKKY